MPVKQSEKQLCNGIVEYLNYHGVYCWRENTGMARGTYKGKGWAIRIGIAGKSDILGVYQGRFLALEVKLPKTRKNVSEAQEQFLQTIRDHGGIATVVTSPEEALEAIRK